MTDTSDDGAAVEKRAHRWLGLTLFLAALTLRVWGLGEGNLRIDEYGTQWVISGSWGDVWHRAIEIQGQSPLYYLVVRLCVEVLGMSAFALRLPSLVFGAGILVLGYHVAAALFRDRHVGLMALVTLGLHQELLAHAQQARPYSLALLLALASFACFLSLLRGGGMLATAGYLLTTAGTWYAHYVFAPIIVIQAVYVLANRPLSWERIRPWLTRFVVLALLLAPGLLQFTTLFGRRHDLDWVAPPSGVAEPLLMMLHFLDPVSFTLVGAVSLLLASGKGGIAAGGDGARPGLLLLWYVLPFVACAAAHWSFGVNLLVARYLSLAVPAAMLILAALLALPRAGWLRRALPAAVYVGLAIWIRLWPTFAAHGAVVAAGTEPWDQAVQQLVAEHEPGEVVFYQTGYVELDTIVRGEANAATRAFAEWPLRSHLPPDRRFRLVALPYRDDGTGSATIVERVLAEEPDRRRFWFLSLTTWPPLADAGEPGVLARFVEERYGLRLAEHRVMGTLRLMALVRP